MSVHNKSKRISEKAYEEMLAERVRLRDLPNASKEKTQEKPQRKGFSVEQRQRMAESGLGRTTIRGRMEEGMTFEEAVTTPRGHVVLVP
jgi:hypothetical protein